MTPSDDLAERLEHETRLLNDALDDLSRARAVNARLYDQLEEAQSARDAIALDLAECRKANAIVDETLDQAEWRIAYLEDDRDHATELMDQAVARADALENELARLKGMTDGR